MKLKHISIIFLILLLSGCNVEYKIDLDKNLNIEENIKLIPTTTEDEEKFKEFNLFIPINKEVDDFETLEKKQKDIKYYNQKKSNTTIQFNYQFNKDDYINSSFVNKAYEFISVTQLKDELVLSTSKEFLLYEMYENLEEVKITINSKYKLIKSNADEEEKHSYTWIINKENAYEKNIYLKLDTTTEDLTIREKIENGDYLNIFTISIVLFIIGYFLYKIIQRKGNKRDQI